MGFGVSVEFIGKMCRNSGADIVIFAFIQFHHNVLFHSSNLVLSNIFNPLGIPKTWISFYKKAIQIYLKINIKLKSQKRQY